MKSVRAYAMHCTDICSFLSLRSCHWKKKQRASYWCRVFEDIWQTIDAMIFIFFANCIYFRCNSVNFERVHITVANRFIWFHHSGPTAIEFVDECFQLNYGINCIKFAFHSTRSHPSTRNVWNHFRLFFSIFNPFVNGINGLTKSTNEPQKCD